MNSAKIVNRISSSVFAALFVSTLMLSSSSQLCDASQERMIDADEVSIKADAGAPFGKVQVTMKAKGRAGQRRIAEIKWQIDGKDVIVPLEAFSDLERPMPNTLEIRTEAGYDKNPWLYLVFKIGHQTADGKWLPKQIHIAYHAGRVESRFITTTKADGTFSRSQDNYRK
jgi:hypothetical protein